MPIYLRACLVECKPLDLGKSDFGVEDEVDGDEGGLEGKPDEFAARGFGAEEEQGRQEEDCEIGEDDDEAADDGPDGDAEESRFVREAQGGLELRIEDVVGETEEAAGLVHDL